MTAREILNNNEEGRLDNRTVDDAMNAAIQAATDRINGNLNNEVYKKKIEEIRKNLEVKKQQERRIALLKAAQDLKASNAAQQQVQQQGANKVGSNNTSAGVSAQVQKPV